MAAETSCLIKWACTGLSREPPWGSMGRRVFSQRPDTSLHVPSCVSQHGRLSRMSKALCPQPACASEASGAVRFGPRMSF